MNSGAIILVVPMAQFELALEYQLAINGYFGRVGGIIKTGAGNLRTINGNYICSANAIIRISAGIRAHNKQLIRFCR